MNPLLQNILVTIFAFIYVFGIVALMDFFVKKGFPQDLSRKVVHIAAGSWLIFWLLYDSSHWTKYLNISPALLWTFLLLQKGFFAKADDQAVKTMTRTGDKKELLKGPLYFTIVMNIFGTLFYGSNLSFYAMGFLTWGDGLAPVIGTRFGKHKFRILSEKSIEGSFAFFIFGIIGTMIFHLIFNIEINWYFLFLCAITSTIIEAISPKDFDNILIPIFITILFLIYF
ncbi:MAG: hypothetical protein N2321_08910 [Melioribacteraceae bacterium]|nr:hypothetical protein [Melioribacteraceae bacterium]